MDLLENGAEVVDFVKELDFQKKVKETETQFSKHNINPNFMNLCQVRDIICRILKDIHDYCKKFVIHLGMDFGTLRRNSDSRDILSTSAMMRD
jgi:hypothetical protein